MTTDKEKPVSESIEEIKAGARLFATKLRKRPIATVINVVKWLDHELGRLAKDGER